MKRITAVLLIIITIFMCSSCGEPAVEENKIVEEIRDEELSYDGVLTIFAHKPDTFCPILTKSETNAQMLQLVFESLIGLSENLSAEPCLAESWSVSEDGKTWTINLRNDVKWHDGEQFTADDVVYTVEQIKNNQDSSFYYNISNVAEVNANGDFQVEFALNNPWINFINLLNFPIIKHSEKDVDQEVFMPVGTGSYVFNNKKEDSEYHLLRNDSWWGGKPVNECIAVKILTDNETAMYAFGAGDIDMIMSSETDWGKYVDAETSAYKSVASQELTFIGINNRRNALKKPEIRRSVSYAVNRQQMVEEVMMNCAVATTTPANPEWALSEGLALEIKHDIEAAKTELESNDWKAMEGYWHKSEDGEYLTTVFKVLYNEDNPEREAIAQMIEQNLESAGMDITLEKVSYDSYISRIQSGDYDLFVGSMLVSPEADFSFVMKEGNMFGFYNEEMNALRESLRNGSGSEQAALYAPLLEKFHQENPIVSLFFKKYTLVYNKRIDGEFKTTALDAYRGIEGLQKKEATK